MEYVPPLGSADPDAPYVDGNPATGTAGSAVPASAIEHCQREIVHVIEQAGLTPDGEDLTQLYQALLALVPAPETGVPVGGSIEWNGDTPPANFLAEDGSAVSRETYADLFAAIGTKFGAGDGATTFNVPDSRRRVAVGAGGTGTAVLGNAVGNTGGTETHTLSEAEMPDHGHPYRIWEGADTGDFNTASTGGFPLHNSSPTGSQSNKSAYNGTPSDSNQIGGTGGGQPHNNLPPSIVKLKCIRYQ